MAKMGFKMDRKLKNDFAKLCDELGVPVSTAFITFAKIAVRKHKLPFKIPMYDENGNITKAELLRRLEDAKAGRNLVEHDIINI